jgi:hypothetical protein
MEVSCQIYTPAVWPPGKNSQYPLCRSLGGPQSQFGRYEEERNLLPLQGLEPHLLASLSPSHYTDWATSALLTYFSQFEEIK